MKTLKINDGVGIRIITAPSADGRSRMTDVM
jgi:hypothetical protein